MDDRSFHAAQRFLVGAKNFWTTSMHARLRQEYEISAKSAGASSATVEDVASVTEPLTLYKYFAWFERHLQRLKYSGRYGLAKYFDERREQMLQRLAPADDPMLELNPDLTLPDYYVRVDIHQHPGGIWSDEIAGLVYEHGARSTTPLLGGAHADLHTRFTDFVAQAGQPPRDILDMACGFGKSTLPFAKKFPKAHVEGIDIAAPCLRLAAASARDQGLGNLRFRQRDSAQSGFANESFDLVTSTMFLHETTVDALKQIVAESFRVLRPGGRVVHLDFYKFRDAFARFMHYGHGRRNNEPYMQPLAEFDLPGFMRSVGFVDIEIESFDESGAPGDPSVWRFPWTTISARRPK